MWICKKVFFSLILMMAGCSRTSGIWTETSGKIKILSTTAQVGDLVQSIGGDRIDGIVLIQGDLNPHNYEIVKGDGEKLAQADLIFYNGLGLEHGASLSATLRASPKATPVGERIAALHPHLILMKGPSIDPHIWMDISLWQKGIDPIVEALSLKDPEGAPYYRERGKMLSEKMEATHLKVRAMIQSVPSGKRYLVTSHDAFHYFTRGYLAESDELNWEERFAAPEGLAPDGQLNSLDLQKIVDFLKSKNISVLFPESNVNRDSIQKIATAGKEWGMDVRLCTEPLYGDAMGDLSYLEMMEHNAETIARYLSNTQ